MLTAEHIALRDTGKRFSHAFTPGRITVVLGRNASGKTALCRQLAGLDPLQTGRVLDAGGVVLDEAARLTRSALVFQAFVNYPHWSVAENLASPMRARGLDAVARRAEVQRIARVLRIETLLERLPHELSGGQQQRVAIGRALAKSTPLLVMDEPLVNLDYKLREHLEVELKTLLKATSQTVIYATSDPRDAFALGDEVVLLHDGAVVQAGTPLDVYQHPQSLRAAQLMSDPGVNVLHRAGEVLAVRPEHLSVDTSADVLFSMDVAEVETNGAETYVHGSVEGHDWVARLAGMQHIALDRVLSLGVRSADVMRFPHG